MAKEACGEVQGQLKLLGSNLSPFVMRVRIALALKGIDCEFIEESGPGKSQLLLQSNPVHKKIPVLIHNGKPICESMIIVCESMIIVEYIEEAWDKKGPIFLPKRPYDRAVARFWVAFIDDTLFPCFRRVFTGHGEQLQKAAEDSVANLLLIEEALQTNSCFSGKAYFGGDEIGFLDIALGGMSVFLKALQKLTDTVLIDPEKMPLLSAWMDRFCEADGVKEVMPDPNRQLEILSANRPGFTSPPAGN